jgi:hypothetical protein
VPLDNPLILYIILESHPFDAALLLLREAAEYLTQVFCVTANRESSFCILE